MSNAHNIGTSKYLYLLIHIINIYLGISILFIFQFRINNNFVILINDLYIIHVYFIYKIGNVFKIF